MFKSFLTIGLLSSLTFTATAAHHYKQTITANMHISGDTLYANEHEHTVVGAPIVCFSSSDVFDGSHCTNGAGSDQADINYSVSHHYSHGPKNLKVWLKFDYADIKSKSAFNYDGSCAVFFNRKQAIHRTPEQSGPIHINVDTEVKRLTVNGYLYSITFKNCSIG